MNRTGLIFEVREMEMMHMHTSNCGVISRQGTPECSLRVLKLTKGNHPTRIAMTRQLKSVLSASMDCQGDSNWQMSNRQAASNLEDCLRHPPRYPNRGSIWDEVDVRERLDKKMTDPSIPCFSSARSLLGK